MGGSDLSSPWAQGIWIYVGNPDSQMDESKAQRTRPGVGCLIRQGLPYWGVERVSVCLSVSVCHLGELQSCVRRTGITPRTSLWINRSSLGMLPLFSCLFLELAYKLNNAQSYRAGLVILKQDLCCKAHGCLQAQLCTAACSASWEAQAWSRLKWAPDVTEMYWTGSVSYFFLIKWLNEIFIIQVIYEHILCRGKKKLQTFQSKQKVFFGDHSSS